MHRLLPIVILAVPCVVGLVAGCAKKFHDMRTPSGEFCSDMPVFPAGQTPDIEHHRLKPISSDPEARTEAERLESLRKAACESGGDAVIEAVNEEVRMPNATYATVSSGTAVIWVRRNLTPKPLKDSPKTDESPEGESSEPAAQATETPATAEPEPPPMKTEAPPIKTEPAPTKTEPAPTKTSKSTTTSTPAPTSTATTKSPTTTSTTKSPTTTTTPAPTSSGKATFLKKK